MTLSTDCKLSISGICLVNSPRALSIMLSVSHSVVFYMLMSLSLKTMSRRIRFAAWCSFSVVSVSCLFFVGEDEFLFLWCRYGCRYCFGIRVAVIVFNVDQVCHLHMHYC